MKNKKRLNAQPIIAALLIVTSIFSWHTLTTNSDNAHPEQVAQAMEEAYFEVTEGNDFATQVMRDPWDMAEFTDISHYLNPAGLSHIADRYPGQFGCFFCTLNHNKTGCLLPTFSWIHRIVIDRKNRGAIPN